MKTNANFVSNWFSTLTMAVVIGILVYIAAAKAENNTNVINGLFTPTQSERFFQAGREDFEREVEILNHPERYLREDLLEIEPKLIEQMNRSRQLPDFSQDRVQCQLFFDAEQQF